MFTALIVTTAVRDTIVILARVDLMPAESSGELRTWRGLEKGDPCLPTCR